MATASTEPGRGAARWWGSISTRRSRRAAVPVLLGRLKKDRVALVALGYVVFLVWWRSSRHCWSSCSAYQARTCRTQVRSIPSAPRPAQLGSPNGRRSARSRRALPHALRRAVSLQVAFYATAISLLVVGTFTGMLAGYHRGWTDTMISRSVDVLLAFPICCLRWVSRRPAHSVTVASAA